MKNYLRSLLPAFLIAAGSAQASLVTVDAGHFSIAYENSFWKTISTGNVFQFQFSEPQIPQTGYGISASLASAGQYDSSQSYDQSIGFNDPRPDKIVAKTTLDPTAHVYYGGFFKVIADPGYQIDSILSGAKGLLHIDSISTDAWGGMGTDLNWLTSTSPTTQINSRTEVGKGLGPNHSIETLMVEKLMANNDNDAARSDWHYDIFDSALFDLGTTWAALDAYTLWSRIEIRGTGEVNVYQDWQYFDITVSAIPEPGSLALMSLALLSLVGFRRRSAH